MSSISIKRAINTNSIKKEDIFKFLKNNKLLIFLSIVLLFGTIFGSILSKTSNQNIINLFNNLFLSDFKERFSCLPSEILVSSIASNFIFILLSFLFGFSLYGFILLPIVPFIRGFCIGISESYLYSTYGLKGIAFHSLIFLPGIFISSIIILIIVKNSIKFSKKLSLLAFRFNNSGNFSDNIKAYIVKNCSMSTAILAASIIDLILSMLFIKLFSF